MDIRSHRGGRETSPDRAKICRMKQKVKPIRKVQVVYYLSRNGLLEHPHFMEVALSPNQPLRLKDVFDRLMALRGSGMPAQYSWSTKRNYKSGYVWHDLALKDIIHPSEGGAEYVLKGSELVEGSCSERFQQLNLSEKQGIQQHPEQNFTSYRNSKSKVTTLSGNCQQKLESEDQYEEYEEELLGDGEKTSYTSSTTTPHSRCSRGVSTEELDEVVITNSHNTPQPHPVTNSTTTLAEKLKQREERKVNNVISANFPKRLVNESLTSAPAAPQSRYSVLLQLIACGSSGSEMKAKQQGEARLSNVGTTSKRRESVDEEEKVYSSGEDLCVSENPRLLGNMQSEEKEYFSGSIVESMKANRVAFQTEPVLKKSNSYNEERRSRLGMEEVKLKETREEKKEPKGGVREKCIPLKKSSKESRK